MSTFQILTSPATGRVEPERFPQCGQETDGALTTYLNQAGNTDIDRRGDLGFMLSCRSS